MRDKEAVCEKKKKEEKKRARQREIAGGWKD